MITSTDVISTVQVNSGIRNIVMPGARMHTMVVMKLTAPEDGAETAEGESEDPQVGTETWRVHHARQRRVDRPPEVGGSLRGQEPARGDDAAEQVKPVARTCSASGRRRPEPPAAAA